MVIESKEMFLKRLQDYIGERDDDDTLTVIEDFSDTYDDLYNRIGDDWKSKYESLDAEWRQKYKERFFDGVGAEEAIEAQDENVKSDGEEKSFDELFEEREG